MVQVGCTLPCLVSTGFTLSCSLRPRLCKSCTNFHVMVSPIHIIILVIYTQYNNAKGWKVLLNFLKSSCHAEALNNPIYEDETFTCGQNTSRSGTNITSDGAADLRDNPFNESNRLEESSPLYASETMMMGESQMERSVFVDNKSLVGVLDLQPTASNPPQPQPNVAVDAKRGIASYNVGAQQE